MSNITNFLDVAEKKRLHLLSSPENNCCRLFNGDGDKIDGLTIDLYGDYLLVGIFKESIWYQKEDYLEQIKIYFKSYNLKGIIYKNRVKNFSLKDNPNLRDGLLFMGEFPSDDYFVWHNGLKMYIDLKSGQSTGLFMDMRTVREKLLDYYPKNGVALNLFCYTSCFSLHALKNGLKSVINVDLSKTVLNRSKKNYLLNEFSVDDRNFVKTDAVDFLTRCAKRGQKYDLIILDPPTFSRNGKKSFSVKRDYSELLKKIEQVSNNGLVLTAINSYSVSLEEFLSYHPQNWSNIWIEREASDFSVKEGSYLKVGLWKIN